MKMSVEDFLLKTIPSTNPSSDLIYKSIVENELKIHNFIISGFSSFRTQQFSKWGKCFQSMRVLSAATLTFANQYIQYIGDSPDEELRINTQYPILFPLLKLFLGECLSLYNEIICMLENGYFYGALTIWRIMYEKCVIADFINEEGEEMARKYYGFDKTGGSMSWASMSSRITKKANNIKLMDMEKICSFKEDNFSKYYRISSSMSHGSNSSSLSRLYIDNVPILRNNTVLGIDQPAIIASKILYRMSILFFSLPQKPGTSNHLDVLNKLCLRINELLESSSKE